MQAIKRHLLKLTIGLLLVAALFGSGLNRSAAYAAPCTADTFRELWAKIGTATLYGSTSVNIWGYSDTELGAATLPGPVLNVNQGDCVQVTLHNTLAESSALLFQGQSLIPDTTGAAAGADAVYTFSASNPGTFLYEAGLILGAQHQVAMGMYGALIVHPATTFDVEAPLILSEIDTTLNTVLPASPNANPASFDMRKYAPKYFLINGKAHPDAASITAAAGNTVLLRYVNAGLQPHAMSSLGVAQKVIAMDGRTFAHPHSMVSETIAPGQTLDALVSIPAAAATGTKYALYDANLMLRNSNASGLGGMLTFLAVGTPVVGSDTSGPLLSSLTLAPNPSNGATSVALSFTANDTTTGNNNITAAEYWVDGNLTHTPITVSGSSPVANLSATIAAPFTHGTHVVSVRAQDSAGNWSATANINLVVDNMAPTTSGLSLTPNPSNGSVGVTFSFTGSDSASGNSNITAAEYWIDAGAHQSLSVASPAPVKILTVGLLPPFSVGTHTVSARTQDALGNWSLPASITLVVDQAGPATSAVSATYNPNNGTKPLNTSVLAVRVSASFSDIVSGGSNIATAEAFIGDFGTASSGGSTTLVDSTKAWTPGQWVGLQLRIIGGTGSGQSRLITANNATSLTVSPAWTTNPNATSQYAIDLGGAIGTGFAFVSDDGLFNNPSEIGHADIPLAVVNTLSTGAHPICIHAKDAAGNWGAVNCSYNLVIDRTPPTVASISRVGANPTNAASVQFLVTFSESVTGVATSNFSLTTTGVSGASITSVSAGPGTTRTVTVSGYTGSGTIRLNMANTTGVADLAGNAMSATGIPFNGGAGGTYTILPPPQPSLYFSTAGNTNPPSVGGTADDADIYFYNGTAFSRSIDASAAPYNLPGANVDGFDRVDATHFYMSFDGSVTLPGGAGTAQDEDVVFYNAGTWSVYFDGTPAARGLSGSDLDAISVVGGILYFSTDDTDVPAGVSGGGDDADIYSWNGTSFARVFDASANGLTGGGTDIDGLVFVDATHFYLSFNQDVGTTVPGLGTVQDEDVVYYNGTSWSLYFDGSAVGLDTSNNLDIDAFDLP